MFIGSEVYTEDNQYLLICNGLFVSCWYSDGHSSAYGSDGSIKFADFYTIEECMYFINRVWNRKGMVKILKYKKEEDD